MCCLEEATLAGERNIHKVLVISTGLELNEATENILEEDKSYIKQKLECQSMNR